MPTDSSKLITEEDVASYDKFVGASSIPHLQPLIAKKPDVLWYYTTGSTLINIIESGEIWSTQISCLNDQSELENARQILRAAMRKLKDNTAVSDDAEFLFARIDDGLSQEAASTSEWFVLSFSEIRDDLSQWRAYGGGEGGYAIGFDVSRLAKIGFQDNNLLLPVIYDQNTQEKIANNIANGTLQFFLNGLAAHEGVDREVWINQFLAAWEDAVSFIAPLVKHFAFKAEQEWRVIRKLQNSDVPRMRYQQRLSSMSRHLPLQFRAEETDNSKLLPIAEVVVGPSRAPRISKVSVDTLLRTNGYPKDQVTISTSTVPFQAS